MRLSSKYFDRLLLLLLLLLLFYSRMYVQVLRCCCGIHSRWPRSRPFALWLWRRLYFGRCTAEVSAFRQRIRLLSLAVTFIIIYYVELVSTTISSTVAVTDRTHMHVQLYMFCWRPHISSGNVNTWRQIQFNLTQRQIYKSGTFWYMCEAFLLCFSRFIDALLWM